MKTGGKQLDISLGNDFLDLTPKAKAPKARTNKWDYIKLKSLCTAENHQQNENATYQTGANLQIICLIRG